MKKRVTEQMEYGQLHNQNNGQGMGGTVIHDTLNHDKLQLDQRLIHKTETKCTGIIKGEFSYNLEMKKAFQTITQKPQAIKI